MSMHSKIQKSHKNNNIDNQYDCRGQQRSDNYTGVQRQYSIYPSECISTYNSGKLRQVKNDIYLGGRYGQIGNNGFVDQVSSFAVVDKIKSKFGQDNIYGIGGQHETVSIIKNKNKYRSASNAVYVQKQLSQQQISKIVQNNPKITSTKYTNLPIRRCRSMKQKSKSKFKSTQKTKFPLYFGLAPEIKFTTELLSNIDEDNTRIKCKSVSQFVKSNNQMHVQWKNLNTPKPNKINNIPIPNNAIRQKYLKPTIKNKPNIHNNLLKHKTKPTPTPLNTTNPYQHTIPQQHKHLQKSQPPQHMPTKKNIQQLTQINNMRVDPVQLYQIKNHLSQQQYKYVLDNNYNDNTYNFSSHYIISRGELYIKDGENKKDDQMKIMNSYPSFVSSSNFCSNFTDFYDGTDKVMDQRRPRRNRHQILSIANLQPRIEDQTQTKNTIKPKNLNEQTENNNLKLIQTSAIKTSTQVVQSRNCSETKLRSLNPIDIEKNRRAKQKLFNAHLQSSQFITAIWMQKRKNTLKSRSRRQMYIGLCNKIQIRKQRGGKYSTQIQDVYSFQKIMNEAQRKQCVRKQSFHIKFQIITDFQLISQPSELNIPQYTLKNSINFLYFEVEVKRNQNTNPNKIQYYREKIFNSCIDSNVEEFMKNLSKLLQLMVLVRCRNGMKLVLAKEYSNKRGNALVYNRRGKYCNIQSRKGDSQFNAKEKRVQIETKENKEWIFQQQPLNHHRVTNGSHGSKEVMKSNSSAISLKNQQNKVFLQLDKLAQAARHKGFATLYNKYFLYDLTCQFQSVSATKKEVSVKLEIVHELLNQTANLPISLSDEQIKNNYHLRGFQTGLRNQKGFYLEQTYLISQFIAVYQDFILSQNSVQKRRFNKQQEGFQAHIFQKGSKYLQKKLISNFSNFLAVKIIKTKVYGIKTDEENPVLVQIQRDKDLENNQIKIKRVQFEVFQRIIQNQSNLFFEKFSYIPKKFQSPDEKNQSKSKLSSSLNLNCFTPRKNEKQNQFQQSLKYINSSRKMSQNRFHLQSLYNLSTDRKKSCHDKSNLSLERIGNKPYKIKSQIKRIFEYGYIVMNINENFIFGMQNNKRIYKKFMKTEMAQKLKILQCVKSKKILNTPILLSKKKEQQIWHIFCWSTLKICKNQRNSHPIRISSTNTYSESQPFFQKSSKIVSKNRSFRSKVAENFEQQKLLTTCFLLDEEKLKIKLLITPVMSSRFYILNVPVSEIKASQGTNSVEERYKKRQLNKETDDNDDITVYQVEQYTKKLKKFNTVMSFQYRIKPPPYKIILRKTRKLCPGMYAIFTIMYVPSMDCGFTRVYVNWIQKKFYFKLSSERFTNEKNNNYWQQIIDYFTKLLKNVYFKAKMDQIHQKMRMKNLKIYNLIMKKTQQVNKIRFLPDSRANKLRKKQFQQSMKKSNCSLTQAQKIMYQDIVHQYIQNQQGIQYLVLLYKIYPQPCQNLANSSCRSSRQKYNSFQLQSQNNNLHIQIYRSNRFSHLKFIYNINKKLNKKFQFDNPQDNSHKYKNIQQGLLLHLVSKSLTLPTQVYRQIVDDIKQCIMDSSMQKWYNLVQKFKQCLSRNMVEEKLDKVNIFDLLGCLGGEMKNQKRKYEIQYRKYVNGYQILVENQRNSKTNNTNKKTKKIIIRTRSQQKTQQTIQNFGFQNNIPINSYNMRLIKRMAKIYR